MTVIKNHVFLNGKIIQIHCKNNDFEGLAGCVREQKGINKTSKIIQNTFPKSIKITVESMLEKEMRKR